MNNLSGHTQGGHKNLFSKGKNLLRGKKIISLLLLAIMFMSPFAFAGSICGGETFGSCSNSEEHCVKYPDSGGYSCCSCTGFCGGCEGICKGSCGASGDLECKEMENSNVKIDESHNGISRTLYQCAESTSTSETEAPSLGLLQGALCMNRSTTNVHDFPDIRPFGIHPP